MCPDTRIRIIVCVRVYRLFHHRRVRIGFPERDESQRGSAVYDEQTLTAHVVRSRESRDDVARSILANVHQHNALLLLAHQL